MKESVAGDAKENANVDIEDNEDDHGEKEVREGTVLSFFLSYLLFSSFAHSVVCLSLFLLLL